jgi:ABC-type multidrug transport system ATPase subunit
MSAPGSRYCSHCGADLPGAAPESRGTIHNHPETSHTAGLRTVRKTWVIGSAPVCDIVAPGATVSGRHCQLTLVDGVFTVEDLGSANGTYVDGKVIAGPTRVQPNQIITLGRNAAFPWDRVPGNNGIGTTLVPPPPGVRVIRIGRSPDNDVVIDYPTVSGYHARILLDSAGAVIEDLGALNGTAVNSVGNKIRRSPITSDDRVFFGSYPVPASRLLTANETPTVGTQPHQLVAITKERTVAGRDPGCDFPLPYPSVSWRHAELIKTAQGIEVRDLKSLNGTFVNGERIEGTRLLRPGEVVSLGSISLELKDGGTLHRRDYKGNVTIEVDELCVDARGKRSDRLLEHISLTVFPTEMVALMGPSGAGKTTLLKALNGYTVPASGNVLFNGNSLYASFDTYRLELGYVPQDDIIHSLLTVSEALYFTARLRTDLRDSEIRDRIGSVLQTLEIGAIADKLIGSPERKVISGGQRKRVNIAMELICDPTVLFLDEPTSGLSSSDSFKVVKHLYELARAGKTIMMTIHQPSAAIYRLFDQLVMVSRDSKEKLPPGADAGPGKLIYYGPTYPDSLEFFNIEAVSELKRRAPGAEPSPELVFEGLEGSPMTSDEWEGKYNGSPQKRQYCDERKGTVHTAEHGSNRKGQRFQFAQLWSLVHRNLILKIRDRLQTGILLAQAPGFALLVYLAFSRLNFDPSAGGDWIGFTSKLASVHFLMVIAAIWFGCNNAVREVVGEWSVFEREQMAGLKIPLYILSKFIVLGALCVFQCLSLLGVIYFACNLQGSFWSFFAVLLMSSLCGVGVGLCISTKFRTTDSALACLPLVLLPMIVLAGGMQPLFTMSGATQTLAMAIPSRWGYEADLLAEATAQPKYSFNPCQSVMDQAEEQTRLAVEKTTQTCQDEIRAQDRQMRAKLGPLASAILPPTFVAPKKRPAPSGTPGTRKALPSDVAESVFPLAPKRPDYLKFLPDRSPYALCLGVLGAMTTLLMLLSYWMLRRRVVR